MTLRARCLIAAVAGATAAVLPARAQDKPLTVLYEIALDIDRDGKPDRAALVAREGEGFYSAARDWFMLGPGEQADLYVYLGVGDAPVDLARAPSLIKPGIANAERNNQIFPLEASDKGSLKVKTAYNLFSNYAEETLTVVQRNGAFVVGGLTASFEWKSGEQGSCDINYLSGKATAATGADGKPRALRGTFKPVNLSDWSQKDYPKACRF